MTRPVGAFGDRWRAAEPPRPREMSAASSAAPQPGNRTPTSASVRPSPSRISRDHHRGQDQRSVGESRPRPASAPRAPAHHPVDRVRPEPDRDLTGLRPLIVSQSLRSARIILDVSRRSLPSCPAPAGTDRTVWSAPRKHQIADYALAQVLVPGRRPCSEHPVMALSPVGLFALRGGEYR